MDLRVLLSIFDLRAASADVLIGFRQVFDFISKAPRFERQIAHRFVVRVEVLMKPVGWRHEQTARPPINANARLAFLPQERISLARKNHDMRAGAVSVTARVRARWILLEVSAHRVGGEMKPDARGALAALAAVAQLKVPYIGNKIGLPRAITDDLLSLSVIVT